MKTILVLKPLTTGEKIEGHTSIIENDASNRVVTLRQPVELMTPGLAREREIKARSTLRTTEPLPRRRPLPLSRSYPPCALYTLLHVPVNLAEPLAALASTLGFVPRHTRIPFPDVVSPEVRSRGSQTAGARLRRQVLRRSH